MTDVMHKASSGTHLSPLAFHLSNVASRAVGFILFQFVPVSHNCRRVSRATDLVLYKTALVARVSEGEIYPPDLDILGLIDLSVEWTILSLIFG